MKYRVTIYRDFNSIAEAQLWQRKLIQNNPGIDQYVESEIEHIPESHQPADRHAATIASIVSAVTRSNLK